MGFLLATLTRVSSKKTNPDQRRPRVKWPVGRSPKGRLSKWLDWMRHVSWWCFRVRSLEKHKAKDRQTCKHNPTFWDLLCDRTPMQVSFIGRMKHFMAMGGSSFFVAPPKMVGFLGFPLKPSKMGTLKTDRPCLEARELWLDPGARASRCSNGGVPTRAVKWPWGRTYGSILG